MIGSPVGHGFVDRDCFGNKGFAPTPASRFWAEDLAGGRSCATLHISADTQIEKDADLIPVFVHSRMRFRANKSRSSDVGDFEAVKASSFNRFQPSCMSCRQLIPQQSLRNRRIP